MSVDHALRLAGRFKVSVIVFAVLSSKIAGSENCLMFVGFSVASHDSNCSLCCKVEYASDSAQSASVIELRTFRRINLTRVAAAIGLALMPSFNRSNDWSRSSATSIKSDVLPSLVEITGHCGSNGADVVSGSCTTTPQTPATGLSSSHPAADCSFPISCRAAKVTKFSSATKVLLKEVHYCGLVC